MLSCVVAYNNYQNGFYYSGQEVSGTVTLHNEKPRKVRSLRLNVEGAAEVAWSETSGTGKDETTNSYSAREDYVRTITLLINNDPIEQELPAGIHTFAFCFTLPLTIPSSFSNYYGKILYQVRI